MCNEVIQYINTGLMFEEVGKPPLRSHHFLQYGFGYVVHMNTSAEDGLEGYWEIQSDSWRLRFRVQTLMDIYLTQPISCNLSECCDLNVGLEMWK